MPQGTKDPRITDEVSTGTHDYKLGQGDENNHEQKFVLLAGYGTPFGIELSGIIQFRPGYWLGAARLWFASGLGTRIQETGERICSHRQSG
jgi:hypothetical protein